MDGSSSTTADGPSIEFALTNRQVMENPSRFDLSPADRRLLQEGRQSMISHTRYGFLLGATLSPIPLFRGQYALSNLRKLPPLMDQGRPNPVVIRARLVWIAQSIVLSTLGSGLGTWLGFKLGLRSMERTIASLPGCRERVMDAVGKAREELEPAAPPDQQHPSADHGRRNSRGVQPYKPSAVEDEDHDRSFQAEEDELSRHSSRKVSSANRINPDPPPAAIQEPVGSSRWEQLRRSPHPQPSTWQTIRERNMRQSPGASPSPLDQSSARTFPPDDSTPDRTPSRDEFEKLLERERNLSAGISHPSDRYSSTKP